MKKKTKITKWDTSEFLDNEELIAEYLALAFESGDVEHIKLALADVAKARNMTEIAKQMGISRRGLYTMLSDVGNPSLKSINSLLKVLGVKLSACQVKEKDLMVLPKANNALKCTTTAP